MAGSGARTVTAREFEIGGANPARNVREAEFEDRASTHDRIIDTRSNDTLFRQSRGNPRTITRPPNTLANGIILPPPAAARDHGADLDDQESVPRGQYQLDLRSFGRSSPL